MLDACKEEPREERATCRAEAKAIFMNLKQKCKAIFEAGMAALDEQSDDEDMDQEEEDGDQGTDEDTMEDESDDSNETDEDDIDGDQGD